MLDKRTIQKIVPIVGIALMMIGISSAIAETVRPDLSKRQPHPPTTRPPEITTLKPTYTPSFESPSSGPTSLEPSAATSAPLSGYIAFLAGALLLLRKQD